MGMRFLGPAVFFFLHGFLLHMKAVDNVNTIIAPTLVGKVGSIYSTIMLLTKEFFY